MAKEHVGALPNKIGVVQSVDADVDRCEGRPVELPEHIADA